MVNTPVSHSRIPSIDVFRLICAVMVVAIHARPLWDMSPAAGYFATEIFPRIGVPFFFAISGYFYIRALLQGKSFAKSFLHTLFVYSIWSAAYLAITVYTGLTSGEPVSRLIKDVVIAYFFVGSYYHFWFFPALLFSMILVTVAHKIRALRFFVYLSVVLYVIGCLGCSYYKVGISIPFLSDLIRNKYFTDIRRVLLMGFPFFAMGYFINLILAKFDMLAPKASVGVVGVFAALWISEIAMIRYLGIDDNLVLTIFLYPLTASVIVALVRNPISSLAKHAVGARFAANFTYYSHPLIILFYQSIWSNLFKTTISPTALFVIVVSTSIIIGRVLSKANNRLINALVI